MSNIDTKTGRSAWTRVWQHPTARLQPLDAETIHESSQVRVWVGGEQAAIAPAFGASALEAVTNWLSRQSTAV